MSVCVHLCDILEIMFIVIFLPIMYVNMYITLYNCLN